MTASTNYKRENCMTESIDAEKVFKTIQQLSYKKAK